MFLESIKKPAISIREVPCEKVCIYGIVEGNKIDDDVYKITQMIEKPKINLSSSILQYLEYTF